MITIKSGTEIKTRLTVGEAFSTPRKYYEFLKKLHEQTETPFLDELELLEWVKREEAKGMRKIYYIVYWYKFTNEIEGRIHCTKDGELILFNDREEALSYMEELKNKNPDYTFALRSTRPGIEV